MKLSVPSSMNVGPFTSKVLVKKRYLLFYVFIIWGSLLSIQIELWFYWNLLYNANRTFFLLFLPLLFFIMYVTIVITSLILAKLLLLIVNVFHKPREGTFYRISSDKDYRYWSLRNTIKKWPIWLAHKFPFPFLDNICFKMFGVKTTFSNSLFEGWVDTEFIEFGKDVVIGQGSIVQSSVIIGDLLVIRKTMIGDNVRIGAHSIVMPGTIIGNNCIIAANSVTHAGQKLEDDWIYLGVPVKKYKKNSFFEDGLEELINTPVDNIEEVRKKYEMLYTKRHDTSQSLVEKYKQYKKIKEKEKERLIQGKDFGKPEEFAEEKT